MMIPDSLVNQFISNPVFKTDTRAIFFLLQNQEPVSSDDIAGATGLSRKCANKATKRLTAAGLIIPGLPEARKRTFDVTGWEQMEPKEVTEGSFKESLDTFKERFDRLESMIGTIVNTLGAGLNPAHPPDGEIVTVTGPIHAPMNHDGIPDGIEHGANMTGTVTIQTIEETAVDIQAEMIPGSGQNQTGIIHRSATDEPLFLLQDKTEPVTIPKGTTGTEHGTNGTPKDTINDDLDAALIRARGLLAAKQASFLKEKQKQPGAHASIDETFKALFGVQLPVGSDPAAVGVMIARKKAGKLDNIKSPLGYLASIAGKVQSPIVTSSVQLPPVQVTTIPPVTDTSLDDYEQRIRIKAAWFGLNAEQRMPFHELREKKNMSGMPSGKVPVELLAFQQFTQECLAGRVKI
jgi:hypothetical protein